MGTSRMGRLHGTHDGTDRDQDGGSNPTLHCESPDLSAADWRVCSCRECQGWGPPTRGANVGNKYGSPVLWRGRWWGPTRAGCYRNVKAGGLLHQVIWV